MIFGISFIGHAQKGKNKDIIPVVYCVKDLSNGLYQASFAYENPTNNEVTIDENGSIIKSNNGKKVAKGLNKFKSGSVNKVFTKEFGPGDYVEWTIISNGNTHTVIANANSSKCAVDDGFIEPVIGNGKSFDIIGQELTSLCENPVDLIPSPLIFQIKEDKVLIEIIPIDGPMAIENVITLLQGAPFNVLSTDFLLDLNDYAGLSAVDVYVAKADLCLLNNYPLIINFARPVYTAIKHSFGGGNTGNAVSQGDASQGSDVVRESFRLIDAVGNVLPVDGTGITIGVMSNSFDTQTASSGNLSRATVDVQQGDLPGTGDIPENDNPNGYLTNVDVLKEYPYDALGPASDEGRAMMHILHDVAPGAALAFHAGSLSPRNFEVGFKALAGFDASNAVIDTDLGLKSNIIVDDITFITEPFFRDGRISEAIKAFSTAGGIHFTSAGNFTDHGYQSIFSASSNVPTTNFIDPGSATRAHLFDGPGGTDYLQKFHVVPGTYLIALQWKELVASQDYGTGADSDLDIYIVDDLGRLLIGSNRVNSDFVNSDGIVDGIKGDPTEIIVFRATGSGEANILITSANGATNVPFRYIAFQSDGLTLMEYDEGTPTISGHAMTEESVTVGAIRYNKTEPESFSSYGGTLSDNITAVEVDFAAPDGVDTNVISIGSKFFSNGVPVDDTPLYPNFFGTSASAPSAAAAVALLQSALPTWYPDASNPGKSSIIASDVIDLFKQNVRDGSSFNDQAGAGMIDANKVFNSLAAQTGRITSFEFVPVTDSENASINTVTIKVIGEFLPVPADGQTYETDPLVYLDGEPVPYTLVDGVIYAEIPPFSGNPVLQIYTEPKVGSEGNGGFSEPYSFFQDGKTVLTVTANPPDTINEDGSITQNPVTIKFGEEYKSKLTYTVEGLELLEDETYAQALERLGFPVVGLSTVVDNSDYPDVNNYTVTPNFDGDFPDSDIDGVPDAYDQCPDTPDGAIVDENGCSDDQKEVDNFTPVTTYIVNFKDGNLAIEKNNLIITPKDVIEATYGEKITVELEYSGYGTTNEVGVESFDLINNPEAFLNKIKGEHHKDFYKDETTGIIPVGLINNFKPGETFDPNGVDRYQDILDLLEHGSLISSENTFINRLEQVPYKGGSYPVDAGYTERVYGSVNTDLGSGFINLNSLDFTAYLDEFEPDESIENGQALGIINGQALGIINGQAIGIINGQALGIINGQAIGIINGQAIGIVNGQAFGIINGQAFGIVNGQAFGIINGRAFGIINNDSGLGSGFDTNDYNKVFSIIDNSDYSAECLTEGNCSISKYYALNLITGVEATNGDPQYIFPGTFINPMSDNFNIINQKAELTVAKKDLTVSIPNFTIEYGDALTKDRLLEETTVFDGWAYGEDIATYFTDDEVPFEFVKDETTYQIDELKDLGDYTIKLKDLDYYTIGYPGGAYGTLTIAPATLTFDTQTLTINYGAIPEIEPNFLGFADSNDDDISNDETADVLKVDDKMPYYFKNTTDESDTKEYVLGDKMDVGEYDIFITDDEFDNYTFSPDTKLGTLTIAPATLIVNTTAFTLEYGDVVSDAIATKTTITGFAYEDESEPTVFPDGIPYLFVKGTETPLDIADVKELGTYMIEVEAPSSGNYVIDYADNHGDLTISEATLTFTDIAIIIDYGATPIIEPYFDGFAPEEDATVLKDTEGKIPYYFMKDGEIFTMVDPTNLNVGFYDVFITDDVTDNYKFSDTKLGTLDIGKADLYVTISPDHLIINQGDIPQFTADITGYVYGETEGDVFDGGLSYYFVDEDGYERSTTDTGLFTIKIEDPENYVIIYNNEAKLLINPDDVSKIRTYADCVAYDPLASDGLFYTVIYRYENDNYDTVYVLEGADNNLSGPAQSEGQLPITFLSGNGTFEIRFDGKKLVWSLTTGGSIHKTSVTSANTSGTGECDAKLDGAYAVYPNPVSDILIIEQNIPENDVSVLILDMYGSVVINGGDYDNPFGMIQIPVSGLMDGLYIVRITSPSKVRTFSVIKQ